MTDHPLPYPTLCPPDARHLPWPEAEQEARIATRTLVYLHEHGRRSCDPWRDAQLEAWSRCPPLPAGGKPAPYMRRTLRNDDGTLWLLPRSGAARLKGTHGPPPGIRPQVPGQPVAAEAEQVRARNWAT